MEALPGDRARGSGPWPAGRRGAAGRAPADRGPDGDGVGGGRARPAAGDTSRASTSPSGAPDSLGLLGLVAGILSMHRLEVRSAVTTVVGDRAIEVWGVNPLFGDPPAVDRLREDIRRAILGQLDVAARLARRDEAARPADAPPAAPAPGGDRGRGLEQGHGDGGARPRRPGPAAPRGHGHRRHGHRHRRRPGLHPGLRGRRRVLPGRPARGSAGRRAGRGGRGGRGRGPGRAPGVGGLSGADRPACAGEPRQPLGHPCRSRSGPCPGRSSPSGR